MFLHTVLTLTHVLTSVLTLVRTHCPLGGFIWDFVDQGLLLKGERGGYGYGYGGDYGDLPNTKQFCINGILGEWKEG